MMSTINHESCRQGNGADPEQNPLPIFPNLGFRSPVLVVPIEGPEGGWLAFPIH